MEYLISGLVLTFLVLLVLGAATGRINLGACCSIADPSRDLRMRAAYESEPGQARCRRPLSTRRPPFRADRGLAHRPLSLMCPPWFRHDEYGGGPRCPEGRAGERSALPSARADGDHRDGDALPLPGTAERALLAQLLLTPGRTLPASLLVDRLWGESTLPVDPMNALQIRVSKLRRSLKANGAADFVTREGVGYRANVDPTAVDAVDFAHRISAARAAAPRPPTWTCTPRSSRTSWTPTTARWRCGAASRSPTSPPSSGPAPRSPALTSCASPA